MKSFYIEMERGSSENPSNTSKIRVLLIEDNPGDAALIRATMRQSFAEEGVELQIATSLADGIKALSEHSYDVVTVDLNLPDSEGLEAVERVRKISPHTPLIVLTGWADREVALNALRVGAQDYLIKGSFDANSFKWSINCAIARQKTMNQLDSFRKNEMEKNELKDRVLSMTAHDIRGSIVGVLGFLRNILEGEFIDNLSPEQKHVFELMHKNCEDVISLSDEIVQARRVKSAPFQVDARSIDLKEFLVETIDKCRDAAILKSIRIDLDFRKAPTKAHLDPKLVGRALKNLVSNAIKFSPKGSKISVRAWQGSADELQISVQDEGAGIDQKDLVYLFDELSPLKSSGKIPISNGLGLVIVKRIAEAHKGSTWVKSELGKGSEFGLRIPANKPIK